LIPDLDAGALAIMTSAMEPDIFALIVADYHSGNRTAAVRTWENLLPLVHYENRQCGLRAAKTVLAAADVIRSDRTRLPIPGLAASVKRELITLARDRDLLAFRWAT
jgi:2-keto-3-deoxy-L-arabinonate dehydratase